MMTVNAAVGAAWHAAVALLLAAAAAAQQVSVAARRSGLHVCRSGGHSPLGRGRTAHVRRSVLMTAIKSVKVTRYTAAISAHNL